MKSITIDQFPYPSNLNDTNRKSLAAFVASSDTDAGKVTNYPVMVYWNHKNKETINHSHYLCHFHFYQALDSNVDFVFNKFTTQCTPSAERMTEFLISPESPYSDLFDYPGISILRNSKGKALGIVFEEFSKLPIRLAFNFIIATRFVSAWAMHHMWDHLVRSGVGKTEALIASTFFTFDGQDITVDNTRDNRHTDKMDRLDLGRQNPVPGDQAFNIYGNGNRFSSVKLIKKDWGKSTKDMTLEKGYMPNPCNQIWDTDNQKESPVREESSARNADSLDAILKKFKENKLLSKRQVLSINTRLQTGKHLTTEWGVEEWRDDEDENFY